MPAPRQEDDDDLYEDDFEFVDDELDDEPDTESDDDAASAPKKKPAKRAGKKAPTKEVAKKAKPAKKAAKKTGSKKPESDSAEPAGAAADTSHADAVDPQRDEDPTADDQLEEAVPAPASNVANYVVHLYERGAYRRTIDRDFTLEDAEAFATEYSKTAKPYARLAVPALKDKEPSQVLTP